MDDVVLRPAATRREPAREETADDHRVRGAQVAHLGGAPPAQVGAPGLKDDPLARESQHGQVQLPRQERQPGVEVEDVEPGQRPDERVELPRQVEGNARELARVAQLQVDVEPALEGALVEDEQRALDAELAQPLRDRARPAGDVDRRVEDSHTRTCSTAISTSSAFRARSVRSSSSASPPAVSTR